MTKTRGAVKELPDGRVICRCGWCGAEGDAICVYVPYYVDDVCGELGCPVCGEEL